MISLTFSLTFSPQFSFENFSSDELFAILECLNSIFQFQCLSGYHVIYFKPLQEYNRSYLFIFTV